MEWMESHLQDPGSQFFIWAFCPTLWADKNGYFQQLQNQTQNHNQNKIVMSREKRLFPTITKSGGHAVKICVSNLSVGWTIFTISLRQGWDVIGSHWTNAFYRWTCIIFHIKMIMYKNLLSKVALLLTYQPTKGQFLINLSSKWL